MGIRIIKGQNQNVQKIPSLLSKLESLKFQLLAVLVPLEGKHHTVSHLKGLNSGLEP